MFSSVCTSASRMDRLGTASGTGAFHRPPLYTSSKHLKNPPPIPTHAAAAFTNSDGGLEDGDTGRGGGSGVGHCSRGRGRWLWQARSTWRNNWRCPPDTQQWIGVHGSRGRGQMTGMAGGRTQGTGTQAEGKGRGGQLAGGVRQELGMGHRQHGRCWQQWGSHRRRPRPNGRDSRQQ